MQKRIRVAVIGVIVFLLMVVLFNAVFQRLIQRAVKTREIPVQSVASAVVTKQRWEPHLDSVGTLAAINGVTVTTQASGIVTHIGFESGTKVEAGQYLIQIDDALDQQDLKNNQAQLTLTQLDFNRQEKLYASHAVSKSDYDNALAGLQQAQAQVDKIRVEISQKHIVAPFAGVLGIRQVNVGQYLTPGSAIVSLQAMDPLYVNFSLPQRYVAQVHIGQKIAIRTDAYPKHSFWGTVTAIDSIVANDTRNLHVQAQVANPDWALYPGLFVNVELYLPAQEHILTVPQTAVDYSLYGNVVFVITTKKNKDGSEVSVVKQVSVKTGSMVGDRIQILEGVQAGERLVNGGQLKLSDGMEVAINNGVNMTLPAPQALEGGHE